MKNPKKKKITLELTNTSGQGKGKEVKGILKHTLKALKDKHYYFWAVKKV